MSIMINNYCYIFFKDTLSFLESYNIVALRHKMQGLSFSSDVKKYFKIRNHGVSLFIRLSNQDHFTSDEAFKRKKKKEQPTNQPTKPNTN